MAFDKMKQMRDLQKKASAMQKEMQETLIEATEAEGKVKVVFNGEQKVQEITIDPSLLSPENGPQLSIYLKNCIGQAIAKSQQIAAESLNSMKNDLGIDLPGL